MLERWYPLNGTRATMLDNANTSDVGYDDIRRPVLMRHLRQDGSLIAGFAHQYDRIDNKLSEERLHAPAEGETYRHDSAYRLIALARGTLDASRHRIATASATRPLHAEWELDGVGNWRRVDGESREHSSLNEVTHRHGSVVGTLTVDSRGNITDNGTLRFAWDYLNRLRRVCGYPVSRSTRLAREDHARRALDARA